MAHYVAEGRFQQWLHVTMRAICVALCMALLAQSVKAGDVASASAKAGVPATLPSTAVSRPDRDVVGVGVLYPTFVNDKGGYVDQLGRVAIPHQFDMVFAFGDDGFAIVHQKEAVLIINRRGEIVLRATDAQQLGRGRFAVEGGGEVRFVGLIEPFGTAVRCNRVRGPFSEGHIAVEVDGKWGFMDELGKLVIQPMYDEATSFSEGLAFARLGRKWGYVNHQGQWAIPPQFDGVTSFHEGMALVTIGERRHHIDA